MRGRTVISLLLIVSLCGLAAARLPKYARLDIPQPRSGAEEYQGPTPVLPAAGPVLSSLDDPIGIVDTVGLTWYDEQQYTTCGKQIAVDGDGYIHHVWTNGTNSTSSDRHVWYNVWDPTSSGFIIPNPDNPTGMAIDNAQKAGYVNVAVNPAGFAFPVFHQLVSGATMAHSAIAYDFAPRLGAFTTATIPYGVERKIIYPKIACDPAGDLQITATEGVPANFGYYARAHPYITNGNGDSVGFTQILEPMDTTFYLTRDIATSFHSNRVAMAWVYFDYRAWYGINIMVKTSDDRGVTWNNPINITDFPPIDTSCVSNGGDINVCNGDTTRPYVDLSVVFDQNDVLHVAFGARGFYYWDETGAVGPWLHNDGVSSIWHWDEVRQEFNIVADAPFGTLEHGLGLVQAMVERPSLGVDTTTGYLYCSYQKFDTSQYSEGGYLQSDAWVSVSADGGRTWSAGTNVTATSGGQNTPAGQCLSERDINIARFVTGGFVHMQYELDLDAGTGINSSPEGVPTHNPILYQRIPTDQIPLRPLTNPYRVLRLDSTGYPHDLDTALAADPRRLQPGELTLFQNYPNPFNPTTTLQFDLASESVITLGIYDVLGRQVATLYDKARLSAGTHVMSFDASGLSSGVYFYRLQSPKFSQTGKMIVMK